MRHLFNYDTEGNIVGSHSHQQAMTKIRGWPAHFELDNPDTVEPDSRAWLDSLKSKPTGGFIFYDCPCPGTSETCKCSSEHRINHYVENGAFVARSPVVVTIDGVNVEPVSVISRTVGALLKMKIACEDANEKIYIQQDKQPQMLDTVEDGLEIQMVGTETDEINVYAPAQGLTGSLVILSRSFQPFRFSVRGWGS